MGGLQLLVIFTVLGIKSAIGAETCGEKQYFVAKKEFALFTSPNYPDFYPSNLKCEWGILTPEYENNIYVQFSFLDIEDSDDCKNDRLTIYQIYHGQEKVVDICGNSTSDNMLKLGSDIRIVFQTNNDTEGRGFVIQYFMVEVSGEKSDDDDSHSRGYTNHWGSVLIIVFAIAVVGMFVTTILVCYCTRKRAKQEQKQEVYTVAYTSSNDDGDDNEYIDMKENDV